MDFKVLSSTYGCLMSVKGSSTFEWAAFMLTVVDIKLLLQNELLGKNSCWLLPTLVGELFWSCRYPWQSQPQLGSWSGIILLLQKACLLLQAQICRFRQVWHSDYFWCCKNGKGFCSDRICICKGGDFRLWQKQEAILFVQSWFCCCKTASPFL